MAEKLGKSGQAYYDQLTSEFDFREADLPLVFSCCELLDRLVAIRAEIAKTGISVKDRYGSLKPNPLLEHERSTTLAMARVWRELGLGSGDATITLQRGYK